MNTASRERIPFLDRLYSDRQMIVVTDDVVVEATRRAELEALKKERAVNWAKIGELALHVLLPRTGSLVAEVTKEAIKAWGRARESGIQVLPISKSEAVHIAFPPGHPREGVLYIGHPATPNVYYTTADFHRVTFEHKFSEAIDLLMYLGATKIRVEHVRGWSKEFSAHLSVPLGEADATVGAEAGTKQRTGTQLLYEASLAGTKEPKLPDLLVWYPHEPTWQSIAKGRLNFGLQNFSLNVAYEDDFGVNAGLKVSALKAGLELGGQFENHEATTWRVAGEFAPQSNR